MKKFISDSEYFNTPSVRFKNKLGADPLKLVLYVSVLHKFNKVFELKDYRSYTSGHRD
ncbi:MAG: hypothetical protein R3245_11180 [Kiloniellales bacterium]|nr:hypothetical protein [Kiloniellales bacterium]